MRTILFILILAVAALIAAIATNLIDIRQTRGAKAPDISTSGGISARGGQTPAFDVETGSVSVGTQQRNVAVPNVNINPAGGSDQAGNATANSTAVDNSTAN